MLPKGLVLPLACGKEGSATDAQGVPQGQSNMPWSFCLDGWNVAQGRVASMDAHWQYAPGLHCKDAPSLMPIVITACWLVES